MIKGIQWISGTRFRQSMAEDLSENWERSNVLNPGSFEVSEPTASTKREWVLKSLGAMTVWK